MNKRKLITPKNETASTIKKNQLKALRVIIILYVYILKEEKTKKILILVILICSTGFFLSACSSKDSTKSTIISQSSTTEKSYSSIDDKTNSTSEKSFDISNIATDNNNLNVYFVETLNNPFYDIVKAQTAYNDITATKYLKINYKNSESTIAWSIHIWNSEGNVADYNLQDTNSFGYYYNINQMILMKLKFFTT